MKQPTADRAGLDAAGGLKRVLKVFTARVRRAFEGTDWAVESFNADGSIDRAIFIGRRAEELARRHYEGERDRLDGRARIGVRLLTPSESWTAPPRLFT